MHPVSFIRTSPRALGEKQSEAAVCVYCGSSMTEEVHADHAGGYTNPLSLDELLVHHPSATFFVQVGKDEQLPVVENDYLGVRSGDILTIDRALVPSIGRLVLAIHEGDFTLCRFTEHEGSRFLVWGEGKRVEIVEGGGTRLWGVVAALSRRL
jgi:SOS-response transcriptional repressor LexA